MHFFRRCRRSRHRPPEVSPEPSAPEPWEGELPRHHDHVVRIGVEVEPRDEATFLATVSGQPWQRRNLGGGRHDVHVAVSGAALGSTRAALAEFHHVSTKSGAGARILFAARLRPRLPPSRRYLVLPKAWVPEQEWLAAPLRTLMAWRSHGTIQARSLAEARSRLTEFTDRNPEAGPPSGLTVAGPPDPPGAAGPGTDTATVELLDDWRFLLIAALLIGAGVVFVGLYVTLWMPEQISRQAAVAFLACLPCLFGVWQMLRRVPEGRLNTWLPLGLTALAVPSAIALSTFSQDIYLNEFGISAGEVLPTGPGRVFALAGTLPLVLFALVITLGLFGLLQYFHLAVRGHFRFLQWLLVFLVVALYGLTAVEALMERDTERGRDHVATYKEEGGPAQSHTGVRPAVVCVEPGADPVNRIGPSLTSDRPVLYFSGANNVDLLWDREHELTKVARFSVDLTPVADLDSECPEPPEPAATD